MYEQAKAPREEAPFEYKVTYTPPRSAKFGFSSTEVRHLTISALLVSSVGLSMLGASLVRIGPEIVVVLVLLFTCAFLLHEIAHKIVAQRYGLWAEFRLTLLGALITLLSIVSPFFKIISPGAVMIAGTASKDSVGKTAVAGPLTNIIFCVGSFALTLLLPQYSSFFQVALFTAFFNASIAVLNLIPIGILDGWKVFQWNKIVWALAFLSSVVLAIEIFTLYSRFIQF
jgi:Zn-dependent protease